MLLMMGVVALLWLLAVASLPAHSQSDVSGRIVAYCAGVWNGKVWAMGDTSDATFTHARQSYYLMESVVRRSLISDAQAHIAYDKGFEDVSSCGPNSSGLDCQHAKVLCQ
jgi:hypothetical protein